MSPLLIVKERFFIVSSFLLIAINIALFNYNFIKLTFGWFLLFDSDLLIWSLIGFGIGGALYAMLSVFGSITLAKKDIIKEVEEKETIDHPSCSRCSCIFSPRDSAFSSRHGTSSSKKPLSIRVPPSGLRART